MVGFSLDSCQRQLGLILLILATMATPSLAGFTIQDLGVLTPSGTSAGLAINSGGEVAGSATLANGATVAVRSSGTSFEQISSSSLGVSSYATSINSFGNVAGTYTDANGVRHGFTSSGGGVTAISPLAGGTYTQANGINNAGQVVGTGNIANGGTRAFVLGAGGGASIINPLASGTYDQGNGINNGGTVVGSSEISPGGLVHAFITNSNGSAVDLTTRNPAGNFLFNTFGTAIANNGDVAGFGDVGQYEHAFYAPSTGGALVDLGVLPGGSSSIALGLNDLGRVVGEVTYGSVQPGQPGSAAFLWDAGTSTMYNLDSLISPSDQSNWVLISADGINDNDQITGIGLLDGVEHGYLLTSIPGEPLFTTPAAVVPEPSSALLGGIGLGVVAAWSSLRRGRTEGRVVS